MKKSTLLLMLFIFNLQLAFSQHPSWQDTITLNIRERGFLKDPIRSKWRSSVKKEGDFWVLSLFDKQKVLQEQIQFKDEDLTERAGPYNAYRHGILKVSGQYDKGYKHGTWKYFDSENKLIEKCSYFYDKPQGLHETFWNNGNIKRVEHFQNSLLQGESALYYENGVLALKEQYVKGVLSAPGKYFSPEGTPTDKSAVYTPVDFPGGLEPFKQAINQKISDKFFSGNKKSYNTVIRIKINAAGDILEVDPSEGLNKSLNQELILAVRDMKKLIAATEFGKPVSSFVMLPITLNRH